MVDQAQQVNIEESRTDVAALAAAALSLIISVTVGDGKFGLINLVITISVSLLIFAYACSGKPSKLQSAAVAAVLGLAILPAWGFIEEAYLSGDLCAFFRSQFVPLEKAEKVDEKLQSLVPSGHLAAVWLATFVGAFLWVRNKS